MTVRQSIAVLGGGSFGSAIANLLAGNGQAVRLWKRDPEQASYIRQHGENPRYLKGVKINPLVEPICDLEQAIAGSELIFVALPSTALREALQPYAAQLAGMNQKSVGFLACRVITAKRMQRQSLKCWQKWDWLYIQAITE